MNIYTIDDFFPDSITHGFFGRQGGVSTGLYDSLNCSPQSHDNPDAVAENRARVVVALGGDNLSTLKQIHSPICHLLAKDSIQGIEEGDALVTATPGQILGCLTADCGPVLFYGEDAGGAPVIGAAHAGWGGALKGVLESTITQMVRLGARMETICAALGPCLAQENYEVGAEFIESFIAEDKNAGFCFSSFSTDAGNTQTKYFFNLPAYIEFRLKRAGVGQIALSGNDTYANEAEYFSYRRTTHRKETDYGRQISAILIRKS